MIQSNCFHVDAFAGAVPRLGRLLNAANRIKKDLAELPNDMKDEEYAAAVGAIYYAALGQFSIPPNAYCNSDSAFSKSDMKLLMRSMSKWSAGEMSRREAADFLNDVSEDADLDWCYAFAGIPIRDLSPNEQHQMARAVVKFGTRMS